MEKVEISFQPQGKTISACKGTNLLEAAREAFIDIESSCNGKGTCGKCRVKLVDGQVDEPHSDELAHISEEELDAGVRLACRTKILAGGAYKVLGASKRRHRILSTGFMPEFTLNPNIKKIYVELDRPSLKNNVDDLKRLELALGVQFDDDIPLSALQRLPRALRDGDFKITSVFSGDRLIGIEPGDTTGQCYGIAVDIGTTTVVTSLVDLNSGDELISSSMINPQKNYGLDVLTRVHYTREHPDGLKTLSGLIRQGINALIGDVCGQVNVERSMIYEVTVAANVTMTHLLLGVDATSLGSSPYVSAFSSALRIPAHDLGVKIAEFGEVYCLPSVSSYIGSDIVAGLIATEIDKSGEKSLFIDIGTNGEIVFGSDNGLFACSCAAGPALEGMNITCGMRAAEGAIEKVYIDEDISVHTIDDKPAAGICGSGIIDAVAELIKAGAVEKSGRFIKLSGDEKPAIWRSRVANGNGRTRFILSDRGKAGGEVFITQKDIRQVQLAKGAILSGILSLTAQLEIGLSEIERVYVAGAFGHHVRMESLARLGVLPEECLDRVDMIGNSSKTGAMLCLLSREKREETSSIARQVKYIELSCYPGYDRLFADCLAFPEMGG